MAFMTSKMPIRKYGKRRSVALTLAASHKFRDTPRNEVSIVQLCLHALPVAASLLNCGCLSKQSATSG